MDEGARARAAARAAWPGRKARLGDDDDFAAPVDATPSECIGMVWQLTLDAWATMGAPIPSYTRAEMPGRVLRRDPA